MQKSNKTLLIVLATVSVLFVGLIVLAILAAIALPAYQSYVSRARVSQALVMATTASHQVSAYVLEHDRIPASLAEAGFEMTPEASIQSISLDPYTAQIQVTLSGSAQIDGKSLLLTPSKNGSGEVAWQCVNGDVPQSLLPSQCR